MNLRNMLMGFMILGATALAFGQTQTPDSDAKVAFRGGQGSNILPLCETALKVGFGTKTIKVAAVQDAVDGSFCRGYILGIVDEMVVASFQNHTALCIPTNADDDQLIRVVVKYLNDNPATLNVPASMLVMKSMNEAFPCK